MKKSIIVICTLLLLLTFCLTACAEKETEQENLTCKEMLNRVLKADSITVECNGKMVYQTRIIRTSPEAPAWREQFSLSRAVACLA